MLKYPLSSYDDYLCLKPPTLLWIAALYLSRAISLPIAIVMVRVAGVSADATNVLHSLLTGEKLLPSALAAAVLYTMCRRVPNASRVVRQIWSHGRSLLAAAAVIECGLSTYAFVRNGDVTDQSLPSLVSIAIDVYFLLYILLARRVRDTFAQFPVTAT
jgi:hypothetical protein